MQNSQLPLKWYKPFAADDSAKVEIPITTSDPTRASQSAGFPPLTMQPPESGGVPPQGEDFNGAMNQVARLVWWAMAGGALPFDAAWATNAAINGYPQGAVISAADLLGEWISTADNNTNNPDTNGGGWVPGASYGSTSVTGLTNVSVTLTPAQAAKPILRLSGALTGNIQIVLPNWLSQWIIVNNTTGAFSVTVKTAAGAGAIVSQGGGQQFIWGDGTNINAYAGSAGAPLLVGAATQSQHAIQFGQATGRLLGIQGFSTSGTYTPAAGMVTCIAEVIGGGGGGGGTAVTDASHYAAAGGGASGSYCKGRFTAATIGASQTVTIGSAGAGAAAGNNSGGTGGTTSLGTLLVAPGGAGGVGCPQVSAGTLTPGGNPGSAATGGFLNTSGAPGQSGTVATLGILGGAGGGSALLGGGGGAIGVGFSNPGAPANAAGAGGGGAAANVLATAQAGGAGAPGFVIIYEYA